MSYTTKFWSNMMKKGISANLYQNPRLCSNGAQSPQATNIWSEVTEKEKRSPIWAPRFWLVWKPEMKPANVLKRNRTKQKETSLCSRTPVSLKNRHAESTVQFDSLCDLYYIRHTFRLNIKLGHGSCFTSVVSLWFFNVRTVLVHGPAFLSIEWCDKASNWL